MNVNDQNHQIYADNKIVNGHGKIDWIHGIVIVVHLKCINQ